MDDPFIPHYWGSNQPGMQAGAECTNRVIFNISGIDHQPIDNQSAWLFARDRAIEAADAFHRAGYHKQIINRLLEPFAHIIVLVTATDWQNFFDLRCHPAAEPHMRELAEKIRQTTRSTPANLRPWGSWHLPFGPADIHWGMPYEELVYCVACCASTSYKTVDGFEMTPERALGIYKKLLDKPLHASPFEHPAKAEQGRHRNFSGWKQYRIYVEVGLGA
jgi:hypothetical protein